MTKFEFLRELEIKLGSLPAEERADALRYYEEYFADAESEEEAIKNLGSPADIAKQILKENEKPETSAIPAVNDSTKASKRKKDGKDILLTILLLIITFPIWIALLSIAFALVVTLFSVALALIISLIAGSVAMLVGGIILLFTSAPFGIMCIGIGLCMLGLFILLLSPLFSLIIKACKLLVESIKNLIARFSAKREV